MSEGERSVPDKTLHVFWKREKAERVRNCRAVFADGLGHLLVRQSEITDELAIAFSLFDRIEVFALEILDERQAEHLFIGYFANVRGDRRPPESCRCTKSALPSD